MGQLYLQRYEYRAVNKSELDQAWTAALEAFARTGNFGGVESGVRTSRVTERVGAAMSCSRSTIPRHLPAISFTTTRITAMWRTSHSSHCTIPTQHWRRG
jgi:hypothetical protein